MTDLQEGLGPRRPRLEHDGEDGEEDDLGPNSMENLWIEHITHLF